MNNCPSCNESESINNVTKKLRAAEDRAKHWRKIAMHLAQGDKNKIESAENEIYSEAVN